MSAPFNKVFADEIKIPVSKIQALIDTCKVRKQTGIVRLISEGEKSLYLLLKKGNVINTYSVSAKTWEALPPEAWSKWLEGDAYTKFIPLSPHGMSISKILIQSANGVTQAFTQQAELGQYLESQKNNSGLSLLQLEWENSTGVILFFGTLESPYSLFISPETLYDKAEIAPDILGTQFQNCTVTSFGVDRSVDAWQEYLLRRAFANICQNSLSKFQIVAGRSLVDSLVRLILAFAYRQNLNIDIPPSRKVADGENFSSPQEAAYGYRLLLTEMLLHFSGITGSRLLSSTLREIVANLSVHEREVVSDFSLFTEGYIYDRRT